MGGGGLYTSALMLRRCISLRMVLPLPLAVLMASGSSGWKHGDERVLLGVDILNREGQKHSQEKTQVDYLLSLEKDNLS